MFESNDLRGKLTLLNTEIDRTLMTLGNWHFEHKLVKGKDLFKLPIDIKLDLIGILERL